MMKEVGTVSYIRFEDDESLELDLKSDEAGGADAGKTSAGPLCGPDTIHQVEIRLDRLQQTRCKEKVQTENRSSDDPEPASNPRTDDHLGYCCMSINVSTTQQLCDSVSSISSRQCCGSSILEGDKISKKLIPLGSAIIILAAVGFVCHFVGYSLHRHLRELFEDHGWSLLWCSFFPLMCGVLAIILAFQRASCVLITAIINSVLSVGAAAWVIGTTYQYNPTSTIPHLSTGDSTLLRQINTAVGCLILLVSICELVLSLVVVAMEIYALKCWRSSSHSSQPPAYDRSSYFHQRPEPDSDPPSYTSQASANDTSVAIKKPVTMDELPLANVSDLTKII